MGPRAASRLEALGFTEVYDYAAGKADWFACGLPREGSSADMPWTGDLARDDVPTCAPGDAVGELRGRVEESGYDLCVVLDEGRVVAGVLRGDALSKDAEAAAEDVMELGPKTTRPSTPVEELLGRKSSQGVKSWIVTTSHGTLVGLLTRDDAERALA